MRSERRRRQCRLSSRTWGWPRSRRNCRSATLPRGSGRRSTNYIKKLQTSQGRSVMASQLMLRSGLIEISRCSSTSKSWHMEGMSTGYRRSTPEWQRKTRAVTGIILGTTTVQKALANLAQSIVAEFVNSAVKGVFGQIGALLGGSAVGGDQDFSGELTGAGEAVVGGGVAHGLGSTGLFGSGGIGGLFEGISSLFVFQRGGIVPSAQGGWAVPSLGPGGVLAQLHSNEMVLPANISQGLQAMMSGPSVVNGSGAGGSGPVIVNISAIDSQDVKRFFHSNGALLVAALNRATRNGSLLRTA